MKLDADELYNTLRPLKPMASHLLYTQEGILDDDIPEERELGIKAGLRWAKHADLRAVYTDFGISKGMQKGIEHANQEGQKIEFRSLEEPK